MHVDVSDEREEDEKNGSKNWLKIVPFWLMDFRLKMILWPPKDASKRNFNNLISIFSWEKCITRWRWSQIFHSTCFFSFDSENSRRSSANEQRIDVEASFKLECRLFSLFSILMGNCSVDCRAAPHPRVNNFLKFEPCLYPRTQNSRVLDSELRNSVISVLERCEDNFNVARRRINE